MKIAQFFNLTSFWCLCVKYDMFSWDSPTNLPTDEVKPAQIWLLRLCPDPLASDALKRAVLQLPSTEPPEAGRRFTCTVQSYRCVSLSSTERDDQPLTLTTERNLTLDYSWRCKYKPLALLHYITTVCIAVEVLPDVWCLRLESIPSQITDSLYVQLSHAIAVWMTPVVQMQRLLCVTHHGPRQPLSCVTTENRIIGGTFP